MTKHIFLLAGEASGDALGSKLMAAIKQEDPATKFSGVGGNLMSEQGLESFFPMQELSLLGLTEIIPHIPHLLKRIEQTVEYIEEINPDIIVTIDAPAFNFRVARKLKERGSTIKRIHYVAPSVWAYKPKRAKKISAFYNHLLTLLPFEPELFEKEGLSSTFIGHPIVEEDLVGGDGVKFRQKNGIFKKAPVIFLMPGSRQSEIKRLLPVFKETIEILVETFPDLHSITLATKNFAGEIEKHFSDLPIPNIIVTNPELKKDAMAASDLALAKSGTGTLELAMANVPMVVTYKINPVSAWTLRRMIMIDYVNLVNILLDAPIIPELLQEDCQPEYLASALINLLQDKDARQNQRINVQKSLQMIRFGQVPTPSQKAAQTILDLT